MFTNPGGALPLSHILKVWGSGARGPSGVQGVEPLAFFPCKPCPSAPSVHEHAAAAGAGAGGDEAVHVFAGFGDGEAGELRG